MHGLPEIVKMNGHEYEPYREHCETVAQVIHRYTDGYEEWLNDTNLTEATDIECLAIAVNDMQLLIGRIAELESTKQP